MLSFTSWVVFAFRFAGGVRWCLGLSIKGSRSVNGETFDCLELLDVPFVVSSRHETRKEIILTRLVGIPKVDMALGAYCYLNR